MLVAPITHVAPERSDFGIEIPPRVKRHLGLDEAQSWVILTEVNRFIWPGPDVRLAPGQQLPLYGALPAQLFIRIRDGISRHATLSRTAIVKRTK